MPTLQRNEAMYRRLADAIRTGINDGTYPAGSLLPSEANLSAEYGVSRPTVRQALAALRTEGLVKVQMGKGSFVRSSHDTPRLTLTRTVVGLDDTWVPVGGPNRYRADADASTAELLQLDEGHPCFVEEQTYRHAAPDVTIIYRRMLPFAVAEGTPLASEPYPANRDQLIKTLTGAHGRLVSTEYVTARMPTPDEATALSTGEGTPVIETSRVVSAGDARPLVAEIEKTSATGARLAFLLS